MTAMTCTFTAIPRSILSAGSVRFFPVVSDAATPIVGYDWDFGDGTAHGTDATPIHAYPVVAAYTTYDITLTVTDAAGTTANLTIEDFIASDLEANVPAFPTDGTYFAISVLFNDGTNQMLVNRQPWAGSHYYLLEPQSVDSMDKIGTMTFSLLDTGDTTAAEQSLVVEGVSIIVITGKVCTFSGIVRRVTQNTQNGFSSTAKVKLWDLECDSDLARLKNLKVDSSANTVYGETIIDSPGNIAQRILT
jgi:PKD repeat protein